MFAVFGLPKKPQPDAQSEGVVSIAFGVSSAVDIVRLMVLRSGREGQTSVAQTAGSGKGSARGALALNFRLPSSAQLRS